MKLAHHRLRGSALVFAYHCEEWKISRMTKPAEDRVAGEFNPAGRLISRACSGETDGAMVYRSSKPILNVRAGTSFVRWS